MGGRHVQYISAEELCPYIRRAGYQRHYVIRARRMYDYELLYCFKGNPIIIIENRRYPVGPGTAVFIRPNAVHSILFDEKNTGEFYWIHFDFKFRKDVHELDTLPFEHSYSMNSAPLAQPHLIREEVVIDQSIRFPDVLKAADPFYMEEAFRKLVSVFNSQASCHGLETREILLHILNRIIQQILTDEKGNKENKTYSYAEVIKNYIILNFSRKITTKDLAQVLGVGSNYIGKIFKKETGEKLLEYINNYRLDRAKELLMGTREPVEEIAYQVGFNDVLYFNRCMKKKYGQPPAEIRNSRKDIIFTAPESPSKNHK